MTSLIDCNLVLKGGVTSGLVHAGAVPEMARRYRFRGVAGSSAGAIAAAFAAAAEYARTRGGEDGFTRLQRRSAELPLLLPDLLQPAPGLERLAAALVRLAPGTGRARVIAAILCFWPALALGFLAGGGVGVLLAGSSPVRLVAGALILGGCGAAIGLVLQLAMQVRRAARDNFGLCNGLSSGARPGLTDWLHASLQDIAFGAAGAREPLTFGHLEAAGIDLRIVATNLSSGRPEITPHLGRGLGYRPTEWAGQLPAEVMAHLPPRGDGAVLPIPPAADLPVLVAVRMSLACPGLMQAVPAVGPGGERVWFADGGLTNNFPFAVFDSDARPTLAIDLDTVHAGQPDEPRARAFDAAVEDAPADLTTLRGFAWSVLVALREGHLKAAARDPARWASIYQVRLRPDEGGMRLDMTAAQARSLIDHGAALGRMIGDAESGP